MSVDFSRSVQIDSSARLKMLPSGVYLKQTDTTLTVKQSGRSIKSVICFGYRIKKINQKWVFPINIIPNVLLKLWQNVLRLTY